MTAFKDIALLTSASVLLACGPDNAERAETVSDTGSSVSVAKPAGEIAGTNERPNVILLVADDLGWADLGFRGSDIKTPHIDRLAAEGARLERFYAMPICTPTRSALMTARDPIKLGTAYAGFQPWQNGGVAPQEHFMPESFKAAGYQTAMVGKWHLGHTIEQHVPNARGFDYFLGHLNTQIDYNDYTVAKGYDLQLNGKSLKGETRYATDLHGDEAARYIRKVRDPEKPFFLYVPYLAPHSPMQAPKELEDKYSHRRNIPATKRTYAAMVDSLDQNIGKVLLALDENGLSENTIVMFFSDNGGLEAFGKLETFEGGVRVSALLRWPARIAGGSSTDDVVSVLDVFPTIAKAANIEMGASKPLDGQDRWDAIVTDDVQSRSGDLYFASNSPILDKYHVSVMEERWKLVQIIDHQSASTKVETFLFDLPADPGEAINLADENPEIVDRLSEKIRKWRAQHPINGVRVALAPHPGWRAPLDYADSVIPADSLQEEGFDNYVSGMRARILQKRHGDKGRLSYE